uniref:Uncharacterized protein n=1 Tax=Catharus ustulatus TaxID=91951 RepID=A0A8C3U793_CATUS
MENAHARTAEECLAFFGVSEGVGLSPEQVSLEKYGKKWDFLGFFWVKNGMFGEIFWVKNWIFLGFFCDFFYFFGIFWGIFWIFWGIFWEFFGDFLGGFFWNF